LHCGYRFRTLKYMTGTREPSWLELELAEELRERRLRLRLTLEGVANALRTTRQRLSRLENGTGSYRPETVGALAELYGCDTSERSRLVDMAVHVRQPSWWEPHGSAAPPKFGLYLSMESRASTIMDVSGELIHGLFQTEAHHRALIRIEGIVPDGSAADAQVQIRAERQIRFWSRNDVALTVIMAEAALSHEVGGPEVHQEQLTHLARMAEQPRNRILVMPTGKGGNTVMRGPFAILTGSRVRPAVYIEHLDGARIITSSHSVERFQRAARLAVAGSVDIREWQ
jgi:transcriptional regulator with XRE-family HTH domain